MRVIYCWLVKLPHSTLWTVKFSVQDIAVVYTSICYSAIYCNAAQKRLAPVQTENCIKISLFLISVALVSIGGKRLLSKWLEHIGPVAHFLVCHRYYFLHCYYFLVCHRYYFLYCYYFLVSHRFYFLHCYYFLVCHCYYFLHRGRGVHYIFFFTRWNIYYNSAVGQLGAVGIRPYYQAGRTLLKKTLDRPAGPIVAASGKQGCTLGCSIPNT